MYGSKIFRVCFVALIVFVAVLVGCANEDMAGKAFSSHHDETMLIDFERQGDIVSVKENGGVITRVANDDGYAAKIHIDAKKHHIAGFTLQPESPWNIASKPYAALAFDMQNPTKDSVNFLVFTDDTKGNSQLRTFVVPAKSSDTYYIDLNVPELSLMTGMRANPESWETDYKPVVYRGRSKALDTSGIKSVRFEVRGAIYDKTLVLDNIRAVYPSEFSSVFLSGLVDEFGQNTKVEFVNKVHNVDELNALTRKEVSQLLSTPLSGRSKYNGWAEGPKLNATGYFRTEKYKGKWSLVDPEGYLFFSNGIANVRMANTSTITGYDFDQNTIKQRDPNDLTPEDSIGLNTAPQSAWPTRHVSSERRANMFNWLPDYSEPLGKHFGYRREVHTGVLEKGETYSFYRANLARKYGTHELDTYMEKWRDTTVDRMLTWGFTSFGNWIDTRFYQMDRFPYFANGWIIGDFKTVSSGNDYWSPLPDPFDPVFVERTQFTVKQIAKDVANSPWCVGIFIDNEKSWGSMGSVKSQYGVVINTLTRKASDSPTKAEFVTLLKNKYKNIEKLNGTWGLALSSWEALEEGVEITEFNESVKADFSVLLEHYASEYFKVVDQTLNEYLPNHLYMGVRFADWAMTPEVQRASAKYVDVMSYNYYREALSDVFWSFLSDLDMPSIIGEFHNGAMDSGVFNPGLIHASSQTDRGIKYAEYVNSVIDNPFFVGVHWFQYIDSPITGRAYDGENYNVGFVSIADVPYEPLVKAAKAVNEKIYSRRYIEK